MTIIPSVCYGFFLSFEFCSSEERSSGCRGEWQKLFIVFGVQSHPPKSRFEKKVQYPSSIKHDTSHWEHVVPRHTATSHNPCITTPGHVAAPHGRFPGHGHSPTIPSNGAPYSVSTVATIHPTAAFAADAYGVSGVPERPKKAPVPNWLREEIKKTVIVAPSVDHPKVEQTLVRDGIDKSYVKADDETDSRSIDSSRSAEDEED
ncbi:unnamed protein product [Trifolium pratense]|uniref:Uncharacterized protein n=1 Tax=Trifolium pratense TaxID=57577 RepID=A0ACB0LND7_TRIPR|nr:unnamed protein product [Trifolium pratense]